MKTFQITDTNHFISQRMQIHIEKKRTEEIDTRAVLTIARRLELPKLP